MLRKLSWKASGVTYCTRPNTPVRAHAWEYEARFHGRGTFCPCAGGTLPQRFARQSVMAKNGRLEEGATRGLEAVVLMDCTH